MLRGMGDDNLSSPVHRAGHYRNGASSRILDTTITARSSFDREDWGSDLNARGARRARQSRNRWVALVVRECGASNCVSAPWAERFYLRQASGENRLFCYKDVGTRLRKLPQVFFVRVEGVVYFVPF